MFGALPYRRQICGVRAILCLDEASSLRATSSQICERRGQLQKCGVKYRLSGSP